MERHRERFYATVAELLPAIPSLREALRVVSERAGGGTSAVATAARSGVDAGLSLADSLERGPNPPPADELALIRAGEESGSLAERLSVAAERMRDARERRQRLWSRLVYPAFLFHAAVFVGTIVSGSRGDASWTGSVLLLSGVDAAAVGIALLARSNRVRRGPIAITALRVPVLGQIARLGDTERTTAVAGALYGAGRPLAAAFRTASLCARYEPHRLELAVASGRLASGESPEIVLPSIAFLDPDVRAALALASPAGRLESALGAGSRLARQRFEALADRALRGLALAAYVAAAGYAVWTIVSFWTNLYSAIGAALPSGPAAGSPSFFLM